MKSRRESKFNTVFKFWFGLQIGCLRRRLGCNWRRTAVQPVLERFAGHNQRNFVVEKYFSPAYNAPRISMEPRSEAPIVCLVAET
jgi:hypothetical protein